MAGQEARAVLRGDTPGRSMIGHAARTALMKHTSPSPIPWFSSWSIRPLHLVLLKAEENPASENRWQVPEVLAFAPLALRAPEILRDSPPPGSNPGIDWTREESPWRAPRIESDAHSLRPDPRGAISAAHKD